MEIKNIYFIEAKSPGSHIFSFTALPRLGIIILATMLKLSGYNTKVFIEDLSGPIEKLPRKIWKELLNADMICVTSITSTANRAFQIADIFKKINIPVAIGGPHSTFLPEESLQYADYVIRGEGEETLPELLKILGSSKSLDESLEKIKGLSYKDLFLKDSKNRAILNHNKFRELIKNLDEAPIPDFTLVYKWQEKAKVIPLATSRGCPFACKFCSVIPMFGREYRFKSVDRILEEIKDAAKYGKRHIFFIDDNFAAKKERTKELLRAMIDHGFTDNWSAQVRTDVAKDPELLGLMKKAGCFALFIGFESINPATLSLYNKGQSIEDIKNVITAVKKEGIKIHGMFVLGSDTDDIATIRNTADFAIRMELESIQFMILTPLPGTPVFDDLRDSGRLIHTDWSKYDAHHAVFKPKLMTALELHIETMKAMGKFYSPSAFFRNLWKGDFYYAGIMLYGIWSVLKAKMRTRSYKKFLKT